MNFEEAEIEHPCSPQGKGKVLGVIVITDNRHPQSQDKSTVPDYRCSGFKGKPHNIQKRKLIPWSLYSTKIAVIFRTVFSQS